eukprot:747164-Pyramimonas_sp.AAC.1
MCNGVGSAILGSVSIRFASWNASSLLHFSPRLASRRAVLLAKLAQMDTIVAVQETHGDAGAVQELLHR